MSDEQLRALERRWAQTGSVEDGVAWLHARLREGGLDRQRLRVAAFCGEIAALEVLGDDWRLMAAKEVAEVFGLTPATVRSWATHGCPHERAGQGYRFDPGEVLRWGIRSSASSLNVQSVVDGCLAYSEAAAWAAAVEAVRLVVAEADGSAGTLAIFGAWLEDPSQARAEAALLAADWHPQTPIAHLAEGVEAVQAEASPTRNLREAVAEALEDYAYHPAHSGLDAYVHRMSKQGEFLAELQRGVVRWALGLRAHG